MKKILVLLFIILALFGLVYNLFYSLHQGNEKIIIKEKWVKYHGSDAKYLISSTDGQVFQITDTLIRLRFDSSNLYAYLEPGQTCQIETQGWRLPMLSDYKNIINAECKK